MGKKLQLETRWKDDGLRLEIKTTDSHDLRVVLDLYDSAPGTGARHAMTRITEHDCIKLRDFLDEHLTKCVKERMEMKNR
jgi:hypothetical protein